MTRNGHSRGLLLQCSDSAQHTMPRVGSMHVLSFPGDRLDCPHCTGLSSPWQTPVLTNTVGSTAQVARLWLVIKVRGERAGIRATWPPGSCHCWTFTSKQTTAFRTHQRVVRRALKRQLECHKRTGRLPFLFAQVSLSLPRCQ